MNDRIEFLKGELFKEKREISIERALLYTESHKTTEGEAEIIRRAKATKNVLDKMEIGIRDGEILAGNRTIKPRSGIISPEMDPYWIEKELHTMESRPQDKFVYTNLADIFPGYTHEFGKSSYRGEDPGEGGYVYSEPGYYTQVALLDVESMHPNSLINLNAFGPYTERFKELLDARMAVKHGDFDKARQMLGGALAPFLEDTSGAKPLAYGLKIVINIVYGLTSAKFENKFKDPANVDNIVAKRGALFMINLKH